MLRSSNLDALICAEAAQVPGTISARLTWLKVFRPYSGSVCRDRHHEGLDPFVQEVLSQAVCMSYDLNPVDLGNPCAQYFTCSYKLKNNKTYHARLIMPVDRESAANVPLVLMFHDINRPIRGWHHMTRFVALGCAVLALDEGELVDPLVFSHMYSVTSAEELTVSSLDSLNACLPPAIGLLSLARKLPRIDTSNMYTWGEGFGGSLALAVSAAAAVSGQHIARTAACNPIVLSEAFGELSIPFFNLCAQLATPTLLGIGLQCERSPVDSAFELAHTCRGPVDIIVYPKHGDERINEFENAVLKFFTSDCV